MSWVWQWIWMKWSGTTIATRAGYSSASRLNSRAASATDRGWVTASYRRSLPLPGSLTVKAVGVKSMLFIDSSCS